MRQSRRAFLVTAGAAGLAGCTGVFGSDGSGTSNPENTTGTETGTPTTSGTTDSTTDSTTNGTTGKNPSGPTVPALDVGSSFEDFEDLEYWYSIANQATISTTTENVYRGSQSLHMKATADDAFAGAFKSFSEPQDMSGKSVSIAVRFAKPRIAKLSVALLAPDEGNMVRMTRTLPGPVDTWVRSDMGVTTVRGDPDLSAVEEIRIVGRRRGQEDAPIDMTVDDIRLADAPDKGYVTLTFDDAPESHYTTAFPMMQEYGFPGVEGVIADAVYGSNRLNVGMMREMSDAGWDMASHPNVGAQVLTEYSPEEQRQLIKRNKEFLVRKGFRDGARHFLTPKNVVGPATMDIVTDLHESLYTFGGMPNALPRTSNYYSSRITAGNNSTVKKYIDFAAEYGQHLVLNHHAIGTGDELSMSKNDFDALLKYVDGANVEVVTCSQMLDRQSQG